MDIADPRMSITFVAAICLAGMHGRRRARLWVAGEVTRPATGSSERLSQIPRGRMERARIQIAQPSPIVKDRRGRGVMRDTIEDGDKPWARPIVRLVVVSVGGLFPVHDH